MLKSLAICALLPGSQETKGLEQVERMKRLLLTGLESQVQSKGNMASVSESETTDTYVSTVYSA